MRYAEIDLITGRCTSVSFLSGEVEAEHMILLTDEEDVQPGDVYQDGLWARPDPVPHDPQPTPEQIEIESLKGEINFLRERDARMQDDISSIIEGLTGGV